MFLVPCNFRNSLRDESNPEKHTKIINIQLKSEKV